MVRSPGSGSSWNWSLVGDLRRHLRRRGPRTRSYPLFLGIRFSRFPGRLAPRPAASFRPRRKEVYYAHPLPRSRGNRAFFPGRGALRAVFAVRPGAIHFDCPSCRAHIPSISPGRALGGENATLHLGALAAGGSPPQGDSFRPTATPLAMQRGRATLVAPGLSDR